MEVDLTLICDLICFPSRSVITYKCNRDKMEVDLTLICDLICFPSRSFVTYKYNRDKMEVDLTLICDLICFPSQSNITYKYNTSVDNTTLYLCKKIAYFVRTTCFDLIRSSLGPPRRQIQELFMFMP